MIPTQYSPKVDRHIYGISGGCESVDDWIGLAVAALDQGGMSLAGQKSARYKIELIAEAERLMDQQPARKAKE